MQRAIGKGGGGERGGQTCCCGSSGYGANGVFRPIADIEIAAILNTMWLKRSANLVLAAYCGGLIASYAILLITPDALTDPTLRIYPFRFALGILIFTLPGSLWVAAIFRFVRPRWSTTHSYGFAITCGALTGGGMLWLLSPSSAAAFGLGVFYGLVTAMIWAGLNRYLLPAF